ncbi:MAG TPA: tripartite tricarboxylate transporter substrate binding protein [Burkholderiales bacterium]|nr:tripartite tricarboxylate transporter substrate binding protein [Burkholderiales bacterium]
MNTKFLLATALLGTLACDAAAQPYPVKPIRVVIGGSPDAVPRILGQKIAEDWGQQFIVDQRPGAGGTIAAEIVAKSAPDGYTLLLCTSTHVMSVNFFKVSYDMARDFAPVALAASTSFVLAVHPLVPATNVKELVALAKRRPGALNFASGGSGSPAHLIGELFRIETGTDMVHVPYKTVGNALTDLMAGQVHVMFVVSTAAVPQVRSGRIRGLGITSLKRSAAVPDLPTLVEQGLRNFEATAWYGFLAPAGTPPAIVSRLHEEIAKTLALTEVSEHLANLGLETTSKGPQEFGGFIKAELAKWAKAAKASGAKVE